METPRFVISSSEAETLSKTTNLTTLQLLPSLVKSAQKLARPPISKYHVGAVGLGPSGRIFFGVNLEFPGLPLHHSVHAEQFLATNLSIHDEPKLGFFAVSSAPCGHCRQFLQEIRDSADTQIMITNSEPDPDHEFPDDEIKFRPLSFFLPDRFGPDDLLDKNVPLLLEPHDNGLVLIMNQKHEMSNLCNGESDKSELLLINEAFEAANKSHSPYSKCPSGVAVMDDVGNVYTGSYTESAAYNPSLGPVQAALVAYVAGGGGGYDKIVAAVLVERGDAVVKQEHTAKMLLQLISPKCEFKVVHCNKKTAN